MSEPRILCWDIETTNLNASFGTVLAIAYKWVGHPKVYIPTILDFNEKGHMLNDKPLIKAFLEVYCTADYTVAHYGKRFDRPFVNTKCLKHGLGPMPNIPLLDTCDVAWKNFKLHSNRLAAWLEYLGCEHEKMPMRADDWLHAAHGCKKAIKARAEKDVLGLEEVFLAMRPWMRDEPIRSECTTACISCGGTNLQRRGTYRTVANVFTRLQCQSCGKWQRENKTGTKLSAA
jgi:uncharacterized protein YprB with RNaseH-like and TPR domain